jgi:putative ABC transport system permease protein
MKYFHLIWTGVWRKKARTVFTMLSVVVAFLLYGMLQGIDTTFHQLADQGRLNVLVTTSPAGSPLPLADLSQIQAVHGVTRVSYRSLFIGTYQSRRNIVAVMAVDPDSFFAENSMFSVSPADRTAFLRTRTGVLVARNLAHRLGWKTGDQIPINALNARKKDGTTNWTFDVVGTFDIRNSPVHDEPLLLMNYTYLDTARATDTGTVQMYQETIANASQAATVGDAIDNLFANSPNRTHTDTERANAQGHLAQIGNFDFFVEAIIAAAFATLLLLTGSTLMQAYRERIHEFAVMKTLGFTDQGISGLVLSEAILLTVSAAVVGLLLAHALLGALRSVTAAHGAAAPVHLPGVVFLIGIGFAVLLALVSAVPPAWRAARLSIVAALVVR